jgi:hypothetical protein
MSRDIDALRDARIELRDALDDPGSFLGLSRCRVYDVLRHAPHMGNAGAKKVLLTSKVWPLDRLGEVSQYDREEIIKCLPPRARG